MSKKKHVIDHDNDKTRQSSSQFSNKNTGITASDEPSHSSGSGSDKSCGKPSGCE